MIGAKIRASRTWRQRDQGKEANEHVIVQRDEAIRLIPHRERA
jgi:hypothetical protein